MCVAVRDMVPNLLKMMITFEKCLSLLLFLLDLVYAEEVPSPERFFRHLEWD